MNNHREAGVGILIVVLFTAIVLVVLVSATASLTLSGRQTSANEAAAYQAVLAGESGQNAFVVRSRKLTYGGAVPTSCTGTDQAKALCGVNAWLGNLSGSQSVGSFSVGNSGAVVLTAVAAEINATTKQLVTVDIQSKGTGSSSDARVLQRYAATKGSLSFPNIPGAVSSRPSVDMQGNSQLDGATLTTSTNDGIYNNMLTVERTGTSAMIVGTPVTVTVPAASQSRASQLAIGSYVQLPLGGSATKGTFKVTGNAGSSLTLQPIDLGGVAGLVLPSGTVSVDYVTNGFVSRSGDALTVQATETFVKGDTVAVMVGGTQYTAEVDSVVSAPAAGVNGRTLNVKNWRKSLDGTSSPAPLSPGIAEGSVVRKTTNAVVTAGNFTECNNCQHTGEVIDGGKGADLLPSPLNDALFKQTFGMTPDALRSLALPVQDGSFSGPISGTTWVYNSSGTSGGDINLNNEKITGRGIMVVDGNLTLNQNSDTACAFSGVLYVRGNLSIQGNLQACGAIVVEGSILSSTGTVVSAGTVTSNFAGTGRKITYSPDAIMDAIASAGPYQFSQQAGTWRQR